MASQEEPSTATSRSEEEQRNQQLVSHYKSIRRPGIKNEDHDWRACFAGNPAALRLGLNRFVNSELSGHVVIDQRLYGRNRVSLCKWNGWGYSDTYLGLSSATMIRLFGNRYSLCGVDMGHWHDFLLAIPGIEFTFTSPAQSTMVVPAQRAYNANFVKELQQLAPDVEMADSVEERLFHGHGHTCHEIFELRYGSMARVPDIVLYPKQHSDVEAIVRCAREHNVCLIPFGGGTSVTLGLAVPEEEKRMVATVSLGFMQKIIYLDRDALILCVEAGAAGALLENRLRGFGVTLGHEPDSLEFSTVGGWVATRASGMKKNLYGNIEDLVIDVVMVTAKGTLYQRRAAPRVSSGPSLQQLMLGSEGTLGIITQVILRVSVLPECKTYGCLAFPTFEAGVRFLRQVALEHLEPASVRLMDQLQTQCGSLFRTSPPGGPPIKEVLMEKLKRFYLHNIKGWREEDLCGCTFLFEGTATEVATQQKNLFKIAKSYGALPAGSKNGERGYQMTFMIAYLRDFIMEHHWILESFEGSMPWPGLLVCCEKVKESIHGDCKLLGIKFPPIVMVRLTQVYPGGAVLYFYFGFNWAGLDHPVEVYTDVEQNARQAILDCGGSISHHHGVGKLRKEFMARAVGGTGLDVLRATKRSMDPKNIFGNGNLI
ncbi:hypothetical protein Efla_002239 [Eimeria flavescens]